MDRRAACALLAAGVAGIRHGLPLLARSGVPTWPPADAARFAAATESPVADPELSIAAGAGSVRRGDPLVITAAGAMPFVDVAVYRLGWHDGPGGVIVGESRDVRISTDLASVATMSSSSWRTGLYVVIACPVGRPGVVRAAPFVVHDPDADGAIVMQVPLFTYQGYNGWGGASLYDFNSPNGRAAAVDLTRPFDTFGGAGFLYYGDWHLAAWLERNGFDVVYATSIETHTDPGLLDGRSVFLSGFHDEYWSAAMRSHLERWLARGSHAVFLGANSIYWQVEPVLGDGMATMSCDKQRGGPQGTFRSVGQPEHLLLGSQYESYRFPYGVATADWVVRTADHWIYEGTGLENGERIPKLVGYEWDRLPGDIAPPGVTVLADSPLGDGHRHHACLVEHGPGVVFNAGTTYWPRLLLGGGHWAAHPAVDRITRNLLIQLTSG